MQRDYCRPSTRSAILPNKTYSALGANAMQVAIPWRLPTTTPKALTSQVSWDGRIYWQCEDCEQETTIDVHAFHEGEQRCQFCTRKRAGNVVVHAAVVNIVCVDCGQSEIRRTLEFGEERCAKCSSKKLTKAHQGIEPEFPAKFGDFPKPRVWGESVEDDLESILEEVKNIAPLPDSLAEMLLLVRLTRHLRLTSYQGDASAQWRILNIEGNLIREYFKRAPCIEAGLSALQCFEEAARLADTPFWVAAIEHNVAMAAYSMLSKYPETVVGIYSNRPHLRDEAIDAANRALVEYQSAEGRDSAFDCARVHHLIGDLHVVGSEGTDSGLRRVIEHYDQALEAFAADRRFSMNLRVSRANAISRLSQPTPRESAFFVEDLREALSSPESGRLWPEQHTPHLMLGMHLAHEGRTAEAVEQFEQAAAMVLADLDAASDETSLHARVNEYIPIFNWLARMYATSGNASLALAAMEALRGATIRLQTMSESENAERAQRAVVTAMRRLIGVEPEAEAQEPLQLPDVEALLARVHAADPQTAVVAVDICEGVITVIASAPSHSKQLELETIELSIDERLELVDLTLHYRTHACEPGPQREPALREPLGKFDALICAPVRRILAEKDIADAILIVPSLLLGMPFDIVSDCAIRYVPSLGVVADLSERMTQGSNRLLVVGYAGEDLPAIAAEIQEIRENWKGQVTVLDGSSLTKRAVLEELQEEYDYIHFCCHGTFDELSPEESALHLVLDSDNDALRVTAGDLASIRLGCSAIVTLSACSSGVSSASVGNDLFGLSGSLLRAGARAVVGSRWAVYDAFARQFMARLYGEFQTKVTTPISAFHRTRQALSANSPMENWAAFFYTGV
jgi:tetratricopeptide (TPR) repeat protein